MVVQLVHVSGPMKGDIQEFSCDAIAIGRDPSCDVRFPSDLTVVSRKHADIIREGNEFRLVDHSANGTFVNGKPVKEAILKNGDVMTFADGGPKISFLTELKEVGGEEMEDRPRAPEPTPHVEVPRERRLTRTEQTPEPFRPQQPPPRAASPAPQPVNAPLVIQYGPTIRSFKVLPMAIGKNPKCEFVLNHPAILDLHAQVFFSQNTYWIKDLTGSSLVRINNQPVRTQSPLRANDVVALSPEGPAFLFLGEGRLVEATESEEGPTDTGYKITGEVRHESRKKAGQGILDRVRKVFKP